MNVFLRWRQRREANRQARRHAERILRAFMEGDQEYLQGQVNNHPFMRAHLIMREWDEQVKRATTASGD